MPWYVFALVDTAPSGAKGRGLSGPLAVRAVPGGFAIVERRADVPPAEFGSLQRHHDIVTQLAGRVAAIVPVRFGTLMDEDAIEEALNEREDEIEEAFALVRDRVQFTWRRGGPKTPVSRGSGGPANGAKVGASMSGSEYLRRAAKAARPAPPAAWGPLRAKLKPLITEERYQAATGSLPEALYHLVARDRVTRYSTMAEALRHADAALAVTGPWPPFAFAPEML
jgi:hypothetical protein